MCFTELEKLMSQQELLFPSDLWARRNMWSKHDPQKQPQYHYYKTKLSALFKAVSEIGITDSEIPMNSIGKHAAYCPSVDLS